MHSITKRCSTAKERPVHVEKSSTGSTAASGSEASKDVKGTEARSPNAPGAVKKPKVDVAADNVKGAAGKRSKKQNR